MLQMPNPVKMPAQTISLTQGLHYAILEEDLSQVITLLEQKANVNHYANLPQAKALIAPAYQPFTADSQFSYTLLFTAADVEGIKPEQESEAIPKPLSDEDHIAGTALHAAASIRDMRIVEVLLKAKGDVKATLLHAHSGQSFTKFGNYCVFLCAALAGNATLVDRLRSDEVQEKNVLPALILAARLDKDRVVQRLLSQTTAAELESEAFRRAYANALVVAANFGARGAVQRLIKAKAQLNNPDYLTVCSALTAAVKAGHKNIVFTLCQAKADPNLVKKAAASPLSLAVKARDRQMVEMLLEAKARPFDEKNGIEVPLATCVAKIPENFELIRLLERYQARSSATNFLASIHPRAGRRSPLITLTQRSTLFDWNTLRLPLRLSASSVIPVTSPPVNRKKRPHEEEQEPTGMVLAPLPENIEQLSDDDLSKIEALWKAAAGEVVAYSFNGGGALADARLTVQLRDAIWQEDLGRVQALLAKRADVNAYSCIHSCTALVHTTTATGDEELFGNALHAASVISNRDIINELLKAKAATGLNLHRSSNPVDAHDDDVEGCVLQIEYCTALHSAASIGNVAFIETLLAAKVNIDLITGKDPGRTPLMFAAKYGNERELQYLLDKNADPNLQDELGSTALVQAAQSGHVGSVKRLVDAKAAVNPPRECRPLHLPLLDAVRRGNEAMVSTLCEAKADPNLRELCSPDKSALEEALLRQQVSIAEILLEAKAVVTRATMTQAVTRATMTQAQKVKENFGLINLLERHKAQQEQSRFLASMSSGAGKDSPLQTRPTTSTSALSASIKESSMTSALYGPF